MNILNTIKKYFKLKTDDEKINMSLTSFDNVIDKKTLEYLDKKISDIENYIDIFNNYLNPIQYKIEDTDKLTMHECQIFVIGQLVVISGNIYSKETLHYSYDIPLPVNLRPANGSIRNWNRQNPDGLNLSVHIDINRNNGNTLNLYCYDEVPQNESIAVNLIYVLDNKARQY